MTTNFKLVSCGLLIAIATIGQTPSAGAQNVPAPPRQIFQSDLPPVAGQEAVVFTVEFAPGQALPWHVHPDGHELVYVLEGALTVEDQNRKTTVTKAGEVNHVAANVGHTARNDGTTPVKALVVRVKDKSKPVVAPFQH